MKSQLGKFRAIFFQFEFDIFTDEEVRIRKARAEDMFVAFADGVHADVVAVADGNEMCQQFFTTADLRFVCVRLSARSALRDGLHWEISLMLLHY